VVAVIVCFLALKFGKFVFVSESFEKCESNNFQNANCSFLSCEFHKRWNCDRTVPAFLNSTRSDALILRRPIARSKHLREHGISTLPGRCDRWCQILAKTGL
jgi:hypothetical protein